MLDSLDCCPPNSSDHGFLQARILDWIVVPPPGYLPDTLIPSGVEPEFLLSLALAGGFFTASAT